MRYSSYWSVCERMNESTSTRTMASSAERVKMAESAKPV